MSASRTRVGLLITGLPCLLMIGTAWAEQEVNREYQGQDSATQQLRTSQSQQAAQPGQPHTAQFRGTPATTGQSAEVQRFLADCLMAKNRAEVEIGQIAQQESQNPQVKEFAQRMVQDHGKLASRLEPLAGTQDRTGPALGAARQIDTQHRASDTTRLPGSPAANQPARNAAQSLTAENTAGRGNSALNEIAQIEKQIGERCLQALKEELQQKQGPDFDKCYIGSQVAGHMQMLASLEVLEQQGPDQLRQIAQEARPTVEQHLQHARQLMKQLENSAATASQAERQPARTQR